MEKYLCILFVLLSFGSFNASSQSDTNHLYLDYVELTFADSTEELISLVLQNESDALVFTAPEQLNMVGIDRVKTCDLKIHTSKSTFILKNINEYISFTETKYQISIFLPCDHKTCVSAIYQQPDGMQLLHSQTMEEMDFGGDFDNCVEVNAGPTGYTRFEEFEVNFVLD